MTEMTSPPAGWYPAPHAGGQQRFWDGTRWLDEPASDASRVASPSPVQQATGGIALATQILIAFCALASMCMIGVDVWGLAVIERFAVGAASISDLETYDLFVLLAAIGWSIVAIAAGVCWCVWQYRAAVGLRERVSTAIRRSPGWHVWSWFIPVVSLWFPYQNMKDIVGATRADLRRPVLDSWWALWIASAVASMVSSWAVEFAETLEALSASIWAALIGEVLLIAAAVPAIFILRRTTAALARTRP